jgi:hypothetical protein
MGKARAEPQLTQIIENHQDRVKWTIIFSMIVSRNQDVKSKEEKVSTLQTATKDEVSPTESPMKLIYQQSE